MMLMAADKFNTHITINYLQLPQDEHEDDKEGVLSMKKMTLETNLKSLFKSWKLSEDSIETLMKQPALLWRDKFLLHLY